MPYPGFSSKFLLYMLGNSWQQFCLDWTWIHLPILFIVLGVLGPPSHLTTAFPFNPSKFMVHELQTLSTDIFLLTSHKRLPCFLLFNTSYILHNLALWWFSFLVIDPQKFGRVYIIKVVGFTYRLHLLPPPGSGVCLQSVV